mgnify:CR=1 FL=1
MNPSSVEEQKPRPKIPGSTVYSTSSFGHVVARKRELITLMLGVSEYRLSALEGQAHNDSVILPLISTLTLVGEVERFATAIITFILEEPLALALVLAASWFLLYYLIYTLAGNIIGFSKSFCNVMSAIVATYGAFQLYIVLSMLQVSIGSITGLGMLVAIFALHFLLSAWILKASRKSFR